MFILTRQVDQTLIIDDNIKVVVLEIADDQIKIGVEAPKEVNIQPEDVVAPNPSVTA